MYGAERLLRKENIYDIIITTDYNSNPVLKKEVVLYLSMWQKAFRKYKVAVL